MGTRWNFECLMLFHIALVVVGLVMNVILLVDVFRIKQEIGYYG